MFIGPCFSGDDTRPDIRDYFVSQLMTNLL